MDMETYRGARAVADTAARALQDALAGADVPERVWRSIEPTVTRQGGAFVDIGLIPAGAALLLAEALRRPAARLRWLDTGTGAMIPVPVAPPEGPL
ncbi:hypothetical protein [Streptomyces sp. NPDC001889]